MDKQSGWIASVLEASLMVVVSLVVGLVIGEVAIRAYLSSNIIYDVEMTRYATWVKEDANDPQIGHFHIPNSNERLMGVQVETNSDGLRDRDYPVESDKYRVAILGDSLTFGWGVEKEDTFEELLEARFNEVRPTDVINFGHGNYNTEQQVHAFLEKGLKYDFDEVALFYFINDAEVTPQRSNLWFLGYSNFITFVWSRTNQILSKFTATGGFYDFYADLYKDGELGWENSKKAFTKLKQVCDERGMKLRVVILPELHDLLEYPFEEQHQAVSAHLTSLGIPHLDVTDAFLGESEPMSLWVSIDDAHPNAIAHAKIADAAAPFLIEGTRR